MKLISHVNESYPLANSAKSSFRLFLILAAVLSVLFGEKAKASNIFANGLPLQSCEKEKVVSMPKGNHFSDIPSLPVFTRGRLALFERAFIGELPSAENTETIIKLGQGRLPGILNQLESLGLLTEINRVAKIYQVDPVSILGPIVTEKVFNGFLDRALQTSLASFDQSDLERESASRFKMSLLPEVKSCLNSSTSNYWKSQCILQTIETDVDRNNVRHKGGTYGIAQFNPALIWMLNDVVIDKTRENALSFWDLKAAYKIVLDTKKILHYIAAYNKINIQLYKDLTCVDISPNPGIIGSVYNLGNEYARAYQTGQRRIYPQENYFGWFINQNESLMRQSLTKAK